MSKVNLSEEEINIIKDSLSNERLNIGEEEARNPELAKHLQVIDALERKLV